MARTVRTILTLEVYHPSYHTPEDVAAILNVSLDEDRKHWGGSEYHINKLVPMSQWDLPVSLVHVPAEFECKTRFVIVDDMEGLNATREQHGQVDFEGAAHDNAVVLNLDGFGLYSMEAGFGGVVLLEFWDSEVRLLVWADINKEEATHVISLEGAREFRRRPEDDDG